MGINARRAKAFFWAAGIVFLPHAFAGAAIDTSDLQQPWPKQWTHEYELGRTPVRWRQKLSKQQGLWAGVAFTAPRPRDAVWALSNDYSDVGKMAPGVQAVRVREEGPNRKVVQVDVKILWKSLTLNFEFEEDPPNAVRFRWKDARFGEYIGLATFSDVPAKPEHSPARTSVTVSTRFMPYSPAPLRLLLGVERVAMLSATRDFLKSCDKSPAGAAQAR